MKAREFINEVKNSPLYYDSFEKDYADFQRYQAMAMETLIAFRNVCNQNQIPYQLAYGSLLGAIRDQGQIPWDYDIDVFVAYKDRARLIEALKRDLDDKFYFYCPEVDRKCRHFIIRVTPNGYHSDVLHVDVFFLIGAPEDENERQVFCNRVKELFHLRYHKRIKPIRACMGDFSLFSRLVVRKARCWKYSTRKIAEEYDQLCGKYSFDKASNFVSTDAFTGKIIFPASIMKETMPITICGEDFMIPVNYQEILTRLYKDYMTPLPLENRLYEMKSNYRILSKYAKK